MEQVIKQQKQLMLNAAETPLLALIQYQFDDATLITIYMHELLGDGSAYEQFVIQYWRCLLLKIKPTLDITSLDAYRKKKIAGVFPQPINKLF
jgi:hypothetical protein